MSPQIGLLSDQLVTSPLLHGDGGSGLGDLNSAMILQ